MFTAICFFVGGFFMNSLCERKDLNTKEASSLLVITFVLLGFFGAIPYILSGLFQGSMFHILTNAIFESVSGYTTSGFSMITDLSVVPKSILLYRAMTQFIGGIGIILILLAFFYPEQKLTALSKSMGMYEGENHRIKKTLFTIVGIYILYIIVIGTILYFAGLKDILQVIDIVFAALSAGGFSPVNDLGALLTPHTLGIIVMVAMVLGAASFTAMLNLFSFKFRDFWKSEVPFFLAVLFAASIFFKLFFGMSAYESAFNVISSMSSGFGLYLFTDQPDSLKVFLAFLMIIGGTGFSASGGFKIYRLVLIFKSIQKAITDTIFDDNRKITCFGKEYTNSEVVSTLAIVFLYIFFWIGSAFIVSSAGFHFSDAIFETSSALANNGLSVGIAANSLAIGLKWLFISLMLLGRVEIIAFFIMLSHFHPKKVHSQIFN
jgi:trk system potassium uptake protein TrkH